MKNEAIVDFIRSLYPGKENISLHEPVFSGNEKKYVLDCIDSTFVSSVGKYVSRFEDMIRDYTGAKYAVATVNGTAALHLSLLLAGVNQGDLVITQPLSFIATCNAIAYCGAEPVFIDADTKTLGLSADNLEQWLSEQCDVVAYSLEGLGLRRLDSLEGLESQPSQPSQLHSTQPSKPEHICVHKQSKRRIAACVPMHTFGHPCEIDRIVDICNKYHIPVVEDAAESIGSYYKEKHTGTFGLTGIMSFNGNKTITTGGGGMIITNDEALAKLAKHLTTQAKIPHPWKFEHDYVGYNYRMPNINAALGCAQIEILDQYLEVKRAIAAQYKDFFDESEIRFITEPQYSKSNYWLNSILFENEAKRDGFLKFSNEHGVMTRPSWTLMHKLPMYKQAIRADISNSEYFESTLVNIPSGVV